jgi:hypothetical protein
MNKTARILSDIVYGIGAVIVVALGAVALFGTSEPVFPDAMIPYAQKELAFIWLAFGTIPMLAACFAVYFFNALHKNAHKARNFILVFLPGFVCAACALYAIGVVIAGMVNTLLFRS